jgi:hypothetical protein
MQSAKAIRWAIVAVWGVALGLYFIFGGQ